jgi:hypothetical protein
LNWAVRLGCIGLKCAGCTNWNCVELWTLNFASLDCCECSLAIDSSWHCHLNFFESVRYSLAPNGR